METRLGIAIFSELHGLIFSQDLLILSLPCRRKSQDSCYVFKLFCSIDQIYHSTYDIFSLTLADWDLAHYKLSICNRNKISIYMTNLRLGYKLACHGGLQAHIA